MKKNPAKQLIAIAYILVFALSSFAQIKDISHFKPGELSKLSKSNDDEGEGIADLEAYGEVWGTTQEEYNYLTKGYKIQIESGLDMKKGYILEPLTENWVETNNIKRTTKFSLLVREKQKQIAAILMIVERKDTGFKKYFCIPNRAASEEIWNRSYKDFNKVYGVNEHDPNGVSKTMFWGMAKLIAYSFDPN